MNLDWLIGYTFGVASACFTIAITLLIFKNGLVNSSTKEEGK